MTTIHCPDCDITGVTVDEITDCADHASFEELQEAYRWLKGELKRSENRFHELVKGTALEKALADLKEANQSRAKLGTERYQLEKRIEEIKSKARYWKATAEELQADNARLRAEKALAELKEANWKATAEEYELALRRLIAASGELIRAEGGKSGK